MYIISPLKYSKVGREKLGQQWMPRAKKIFLQATLSKRAIGSSALTNEL
jgi:hypothetical protein